MKEKGKIYCKDCKFRKLKAIRGWCCKLKYRMYKDAIGFEYTDYSKADCEIINKDNDCKDFKLKWYKELLEKVRVCVLRLIKR